MSGKEYSMVQELTDSYLVTTRPDGGIEIRIAVPARFADLWKVKLSELATNDAEILEHAP